MEVQNIDLAKLVRHSVQSFQVRGGERGIELVRQGARVASAQIYVPMDPTKIAWALSNLLTNALRHTPRGKVASRPRGRVQRRVESRSRAGHGPGHRPQAAGAASSTNSILITIIRVARTGSAGMGLAIAREIVVAHGGQDLGVQRARPRRGVLLSRCRSSVQVGAEARRLMGTDWRRDDSTAMSMKGAMSGTPARSG